MVSPLALYSLYLPIGLALANENAPTVCMNKTVGAWSIKTSPDQLKRLRITS